MAESKIDERDQGPFVGVGLRHDHYDDVLSTVADIDFVEVHAENYYMDGGLALSLLAEVRNTYSVSVHATSLGLGSAAGIPNPAIAALKRLVDRIDPILISDHAAFCWAGSATALQHSGDLLPFALNQGNLQRFVENVDRVQQIIGRRMLIENISSYLSFPDNTMREYDFLQRVCTGAGCGLLLDINNLYVNMINREIAEPLSGIKSVIDSVDGQLVGEIHLAGCSAPAAGLMMIDDHSEMVSETVWQAYGYALSQLGSKPTLVEWDTRLPSWSVLINEALTARRYGKTARRL